MKTLSQQHCQPLSGSPMDADDIRILASRNVGVSHNPESNMKLASGTAPVPVLRRARVGVPQRLPQERLARSEVVVDERELHARSVGEVIPRSRAVASAQRCRR